MAHSALKFSVVTPSYNQGNFIEQTIQSVLDQQYPNLEYLILDGGSQDQSLATIQKYAPHLAYWVSGKDGGQANAINNGFKRCSGDIAAWLNSDDVYVPGTFAFVNDFFLTHPDVDFVYGDAEIIDPAGQFVMHRKELPVDTVMGDLIGWGLLIPQPSAFWRRQVFEQSGYLDETLNYGLDADLWFRMSRHVRMQHVPRLFSRQRYHPDAKTIKGVTADPNYHREISGLMEKSYSRLRIARLIPFRFSWLPRNLYRVKRIFYRLILGHYFSGYIPDVIQRGKST